MSTSWNSVGGSESGILRKTTPKPFVVENREDLLVFGYACKIFRDDEKAIHVDQGKHLIPWMGDNSHKIDRYDVRATLSDLSQYEPPPGGYSNRTEYLSAAEQRAEQLCEEERYFSLFSHEVDEEIYQEEDLKRLHQSRSGTYGQVAFNHDAPTDAPKVGPEQEKDEEQDEPFEPPKNFDIPADIDLPETMKLHAIIEKTARFIAQQGMQMEILIKAKQSNNPQFEFLNQKNRLNRYYKHMLGAIKAGLYVTEEESSSISAEDSENTQDSTTSLPPVMQQIVIPTIKYKPSADCAYTQLISKIKGVPLPAIDSDASRDSESPGVSWMPPVQSASTTTITDILQPTVAKQLEAKLQSQADGGVVVNKISTGLMLAQYYNSDSETEQESDEEDKNATNSVPVVPKRVLEYDSTLPPTELQNIIDKTAAYVIKNGKEFEDTLRMKKNEKFSFLDEGSEFYRYYRYKVSGQLLKIPPPQPIKSVSPPKPKIITPVSFCIKTKEEPVVPIKAALPQEPSSDEDEKNHKVEVKPADFPEIKSPAKLNGDNHPVAIPVPKENSAIDTSIDKFRDNLLESENLEKKEARRAEEKVKDKLAQMAREKLGMISKEKQLQLERKKRAMAFLNQIKRPSIEEHSTPTSSAVPELNTLAPSSVPVVDISEEIQHVHGSDSDSTQPPHEKENNKVHQNGRDNSGDSRDKNVRGRRRTRSRSRSRSRSRKSSSRKHKKKKSKHSHSKKKSKKRSRSKSRSKAPSECHIKRSRSRSRSHSDDGRKRQKKSHKSKTRSRDD